MHRLAPALLGLALLLPLKAARADMVEITFDFGSSVLTVVSTLTITVPPDGQINRMGAVGGFPAIQTASGATMVQTGNANIKSLTLQLTIDGGVALFGKVDGTVTATQLGTSTGPFTNTQSAVFGTPSATGNGLSIFLRAMVDCAGFLCPGSFPINISATQPAPTGNGNTYTLMFHNLNTPGAASITGSLPISLAASGTGSPLNAMFNLTGVEVSRTFVVPEPAYLALLVPGVAAVAAVGLLGRRRRRR